jgi:putative oxidoreductase
MKEKLFFTRNSWEGLVLRFFAGLVMFPHGAQKLLGWFGGYGFSGTMGFFTDTMGLPWLIAFLVIVIEFFGSLLLLAGLGTRIVSATFIILLLGIVFTSHLQHGFFMNWAGAQAGEGIEYFLLYLGICIALLFTGGGKYSTDRTVIKA